MCLILANSYPLPSFLFSSVFSTRSLHLILACSCLAPSLIFSSLLPISVWSILAFPLMPPVYFLPFPPLLTLPLSPHFFPFFYLFLLSPCFLFLFAFPRFLPFSSYASKVCLRPFFTAVHILFLFNSSFFPCFLFLYFVFFI